jgi:hypothetical protein
MRVVWLCLFAASAVAQERPASHPGCAAESAGQCVDLALTAMGGREPLAHLKSLRFQTAGHTMLMEQSYRQEPFITAYERGRITLDLANQRALTESKVTWPQSDPHQPDFESTIIVGPDGCVNRTKDGDRPAGLGSLEAAREMLALGPARILLTAAAAPDLHFAAPETLRSTAHSVVAFTWQKVPVRVLLNAFNHLPDAVETIEEFHDFWYFWGDVQQRIYFDNWRLFQDLVLPTNLVTERNGAIWSSTQMLNVELNVPIDDATFAMDAKLARQSAASHGWERPFRAGTAKELAPGVDLFEGAWNSTVIRQPDGIVILEAPISGLYTQGVAEEARKRYPGLAVKAVLSTSDSWPHVGGVRYAVAQGLTVYILDLSRPLLDRMIAAPHTLNPDALANAKNAKPLWRMVSHKEEVGAGENRLELYPLRGASTERQYMVYFPEHRLLYASDTLSLNEDGTLYDPELMDEVERAVTRENLKVDTVFAMHQGPMPWSQVVALVEKSRH